MADDNDTPEKDAGDNKKSGLSTGAIIGIIGGALLLQALVVVFALKWVVSDAPGGEKAKTEHAADEHGDEQDGDEDHGDEAMDHEPEMPRHKRPVNHVVELEDIIVNPADQAGKFVVAGIGLEFANAEEAAELEKVLIPVRTLISRQFASMTVDRLRDVAVRDSLSKVLRRDLAPFFSEAKLYEVYISKFLIQ